jgi:hypothetical protein
VNGRNVVEVAELLSVRGAGATFASAVVAARISAQDARTVTMETRMEDSMTDEGGEK